MTPEQLSIIQWTGIALGSVLLLAVAWVWVRKQVFGLSGATISLVGVVLVGLTIWQSISFEYGKDGISVRLDRLQQQLDETQTELQQANASLDTVRRQNVMLSEQILRLDDVARLQDSRFENVVRHLQQSGFDQPPVVTPGVQIDRSQLQEMLQDQPLSHGQ